MTLGTSLKEKQLWKDALREQKSYKHNSQFTFQSAQTSVDSRNASQKHRKLALCPTVLPLKVALMALCQIG
jgi:hypothetical protein